MKKRMITAFICMSVLGTQMLFADVVATISTNGMNASFTNNTNAPWRLGGIRYWSEKKGWDFWWGAADGYTIHNDTLSPTKLEVNAYYKSDALSTATSLKPATTDTWISSFAHPWDGLDSTFLPLPETTPELLLRTGAPGIPPEPDAALPITLNELRGLIETPDFYNPDYRYSYYDSLGVNGGKYSGGFMDTWLGQTQLHFAHPTGGFNVNMTDVVIAKGAQEPHYWISLAMGQELFNVDAQWMFAIGAKETRMGTNQPIPDTNLGQTGVYGHWQIENSTGLDRALSYPQFFPQYEEKLSSARDVTTSGVNMNEFMSYYIRGSRSFTPRNSALMFNAFFMSAIVWYGNYDVCSYATDICWAYGLENTMDPYMGIAAMASMYNLGQWGQIGAVVGALNSNVVDQTINKTNARDEFAEGNSGYRTQILAVVQELVDASKNFEINNNTSDADVIDYEITLSLLRDMFFGDNGTVQKQGDGGLLLHYCDPNTGSDVNAPRQKIWDILEEAFNIVKGKAPSASENTISYRYDLLSVLRTVKADFPFDRNFRVSGDAGNLVPGNSGNYPAHPSSPELDDVYPYASFSEKYNHETNVFTLIDTMTDNQSCGQVKWTLDYDWEIWNTATVVDTQDITKSIFQIDIPQAMVKEFRDRNNGESGYFVWIMSEDASGNSVIHKRAVPYYTDEFPYLNWAAAYDTDGDGNADHIKANIALNNLTSPLDFNSLAYTWPETTPETTLPKGHASVSAENTVLLIDNITIPDGKSGGAGLGSLALYLDQKYLPEGKDRIETDVLDSVGPALIGEAHFRPSADGIKPESLLVVFSEPIIGLKNDAAQLAFSTDKSDSSALIQQTTESSKSGILFLYTAGTIMMENQENNWVKIVADGDITDNSPAKNTPLEINQWIFIINHETPDVFPTVESAQLFDTWGMQDGGKRVDGNGDSLFVSLRLSTDDEKLTTSSIESISLEWNGQTVSGSITPIDAQSFYFIDSTLTGGNGSGNIHIIFKDANAGEKQISGLVEDNIAPVIKSTQYEHWVGRQDTLRVVFSEALSSSKVAPNSLKTNNGTLQIQEISRDGNTVVFVVESGRLFHDSELWIAPNTGIKDERDIEQIKEENWHVTLETYRRFVPFELREAFYKNTANPADGKIDQILLEFNFNGADTDLYQDKIAEIIANGITLSDTRGFKQVLKEHITILNESQVSIQVTQQDTVSVNTAIILGDVIQFSGKANISDTLSFEANNSVDVKDSIAPIIMEAEYRPMVINTEEEIVFDTLIITFSEDVRGNINSSALEGFDFSEEQNYSFSFSEEETYGTEKVTILVTPQTEDVLPEMGDSIRIVSGIKDVSGIEQEVKTIYAPLIVGRYQYNYNIMISPSPYSVDEAENNPMIEEYGDGTDLTDLGILIKPIGNRKITGLLAAQIVVLDQTGNKVIGPESFEFNQNAGVLLWTWNGRNHSNRVVGAGAYIAIIEVEDENSETEVVPYRKMIGIQK